jgi:hypothetical protein
LKIEKTKYFVRSISLITTIVAFVCVCFTVSGCGDFIGFLLTPGAFEKGVTPAYDLLEQQDRRVMIWVECPHSANADFDVQEKLATAFQLYLVGKAGFDSENIVLASLPDSESLFLDPKNVARSQGVGYLLLVQIDQYESDFLHIRDYFAGEMITRSVRFDVDSDEVLWPSQPEGKVVHVAVEMETEGRDALVARLTSSTAHCVSRNLYPCEKLKYKTADERVSLQEAYEMETY